MLEWLVDRIKCLIQGHCFKEWGSYRYCLRCGHLEVTKDICVMDTGAEADDVQPAHLG